MQAAVLEFVVLTRNSSVSVAVLDTVKEPVRGSIVVGRRFLVNEAVRDKSESDFDRDGDSVRVLECEISPKVMLATSDIV